VDLRDQVVEVGVVEEEPPVVEGVGGVLELLADQLGDLLLGVGHGLAGRGLPAHAGVPRGDQAAGALQRQCGRGK
jgi:hypothetical protein